MRQLREIDATEHQGEIHNEQEFRNEQEKLLFEKKVRSDRVNKYIKQQRLKFLKNSRTKLLNQLNAGQKPTIEPLHFPFSMNTREAKDFATYRKIREDARKGKVSQQQLSDLLLKCTFGDEDLANGQNENERRLEFVNNLAIEERNLDFVDH